MKLTIALFLRKSVVTFENEIDTNTLILYKKLCHL